MLVFFLSSFLIISNFDNDAFAYDQSGYRPVWDSKSNGVIVDSDYDGRAEQVFTYAISGQDYIFTIRYGNSTSQTITMPVGYTFKSITTDKNFIYLGSSKITGTTCDTNLGMFDVLTGTVTNTALSDTTTDTAGVTTCFASGMRGSLNEPILNTYSDGGAGPDYVKIKNSTYTFYSNTANVDGNYWYSNTWFASSPSMTPVNRLGATHTAMTPTSQSAFTLGNCNTSLKCIANSGGTFFQILPTATARTSSLIASPSMQLFESGMLMPISSEGIPVPTRQPYWYYYVPNYLFSTTIDDAFTIATLPFRILDTAVTSEPIRGIFDDGNDKYVFYANSGTSAYRMTPADIGDRSSSYYIIDTDPPIFSTESVSSSLTTRSVYLSSPAGSFTENMAGLISLVSASKISPTSTVNRIINSDITNGTTFFPYLVGPTVSLAELSIIVKNSPTDAGLVISDSTSFNSVNYIWGADILRADKSFTIELPDPSCVDVYLKDLTIDNSNLEFLGSLCNTGTMPKTITYSSNLSFTFWSLPYGVTHTFEQSTDTLTTKIRHDTVPYDYTVKIYDANNVLQYDNTFTENSTSIDLQNINASGIDLPAMLKVFDEDSNQLYYASIGTPNYFSGTVAWFTQWLSIDGFNILFMLPIIFSAMFTRNTVSIGTTITVVFIATLTFFGILPIPDLVIYFMIVIAIIGMIAYKKLYD